MATQNKIDTGRRDSLKAMAAGALAASVGTAWFGRLDAGADKFVDDGIG